MSAAHQTPSEQSHPLLRTVPSWTAGQWFRLAVWAVLVMAIYVGNGLAAIAIGNNTSDQTLALMIALLGGGVIVGGMLGAIIVGRGGPGREVVLYAAVATSAALTGFALPLLFDQSCNAGQSCGVLANADILMAWPPTFVVFLAPAAAGMALVRHFKGSPKA